MGKCNSTAMMWMVMKRGGESVWARINYGRSNQVIMQSRQQPSGKKLITAPDRSRSRRRGRARRRRRGGWWGRRRNILDQLCNAYVCQYACLTIPPFECYLIFTREISL